jgi:hypothetical protein
MVYVFGVVELSDTQGYWFALLDEAVGVLFTVTAKYRPRYFDTCLKL